MVDGGCLDAELGQIGDEIVWRSGHRKMREGRIAGLVAASSAGGNSAPARRVPPRSAFFRLACDLKMLQNGTVLERAMDLSIKGVPEHRVRRLRERAKANHRSLQD